MRDELSFRLRSRTREMSASIASEAQRLVMGAAEPVSAGETVKAQMRRAWERLGRPSWWRIRAAWYGEASCWSAAALEDLRNRAGRWSDKQRESGRAEAENLAAVLSRFLEADAPAAPHLAREDLAQARDLVRRLCGGSRT
jgi:hypothetical protein